MPYASLTKTQKHALNVETSRRTEAHEPITCRDMAVWCKETFRLPAAPGKSTIARVVKQAKQSPNSSHALPRHPVGVSKSFRQRHGANHKLEDALFGWVCTQYALRRMINGNLIMKQARCLQAQCNARLPDGEKCTLKFTLGWLDNFTRWNLKSFEPHGESGDANVSAVEEALPDLIFKIQQFEPKNVFNVDECGLFYKLAPDRTIAPQRPPGRKKNKDRITVLVCANADGSERFELMFIGSVLRPHAFKKKSDQEHGLNYHANKNAWMTVVLFYDWLRGFDARFDETGRKILLLLDNCSAHGSVESAPDLKNVKLFFLPPNTTSKIQPCDAGIIAALKVCYRNYQIDRALDLAEDESVLDIYKVDILSAMQALKRIWNAMDCQVIAYCWHHTGSIDCSADVEVKRDEQEKVLDDCIRQIVPPAARMEISHLLNPEGEDNCVADVADNFLIGEMFGTSDDRGDHESDTDADEVAPLPSLNTQLQAVALCKRLCDAYNISDTVRSSIACLQREVRRAERGNIQQATLDAWVSK